MSLIKEIDVQKSRNNARNVLKTFRPLARIAGTSLSSLHSPSLDGMPRSDRIDQGLSPRELELLKEKYEAGEELNKIVNALKNISTRSYWTLYYSYCTKDPLSYIQIAERLKWYSDTSISYLKRQALSEFYEAYDHGSLIEYKEEK
ncbi:ArpU family phage packaging/lysis transcriptional regulator [Agrilactobacillus fermenti]|uniref:ArpU family phage packaging/lysis transcriptional regulator n=1 Tax=Agrilactobacillus fermenti TaxID=2586909 RepID=UPI001E4D3502|nr:ArpU family phage packaging/lysis transcriptional regulator [Agrilactobacillus fermenti]MCD2257497.1 autolysin [Agrilactobacillus fermenti]